MSKIFFISDLHFNHENIIKYCNRPFPNVDKMNSSIINNWNSVVSKDDVVYFLGDFMFGPKTNLPYFRQQLNGRVHFIIGNHDRFAKKAILDAGFESVSKHKTLSLEDGQRLLLTHYPKEVDGQDIVVFGHVHDLPVSLKCRHFCVCVEKINYTPIELNELLAQIK